MTIPINHLLLSKAIDTVQHMDGNAIFTVLNKSSIGSDRTSQILLYVTIYTNYTSWKPVTWLGTSISTMKV